MRHVAKSIRGGAGKGGTKYKPYTGVVKPLPKVSSLHNHLRRIW